MPLAEYVAAEALAETRHERGVWELHFFGPGESVEPSSLGASLSFDAIYANPLTAP